MARYFDDAFSQYLQYGTAVVTAAPLTLAAWFNSDDTSINQDLVCITDTAGDQNYFQLTASSATRVVAVARDSAPANTATTSTTWSANVWNHACGVFESSTSRLAYLNGGGVGTNSNNRTPAGLDVVSIGRLSRATPANHMSGRIAHAAIWNAALGADEVVSLAKGFVPWMIRPESLVAYWPIWGNSSPEPDVIGGANATVNGATASAAYPMLIYPTRRKVFSFSAAAPTAKLFRQGSLSGLGTGGPFFHDPLAR